MEKKRQLTDAELLNELNDRFEQNHLMLNQLEELNEKLIDSEMVKSHFLSNIKNEINNPLSAILGLAQGIMHKPADLDIVSNSSRLIFEEAFNLNFQLKNIFLASEIEAGQAYPEISSLDVQPIIESIIESYQFMAIRKNLELKINLETDLQFKTDTQMLGAIISNLISNAIKFSNENGKVEVSAHIVPERKLIIKIHDDGIGINEQNQNIIFDRFKQLDSGTTKRFSGQGLGLSVVSSLIDLLKGRIEASCEVNQGCSFIVIIPENETETDKFSSSDNSFLFFDDEKNSELF